MLRLRLVVLMAISAIAAGGTCRALSLEGGGSKGAYQAGALVTLTTQLPGEDIQWNVVTGISTGALNSGGVSMFAMGQEAEMAQFLKSVWLSLNGSASVFENWNVLGIPYAVINEPSLYNTQPLRNTLTKLFTQGIHRNVTIGSTNLNTGLFGNFNESVGSANIIEAIICSAAPPFFFPPQNFLGAMWADGGCIINLDVFSAVERCLDVVEDESDIIVDMIFCSGASLASVANASAMVTSDVMGRVNNIKSYDSSMWYAYNAMQAYPNVNYRYMIVPSKPMAGSILPLDFDQANLESELALGESDAAAVISNGADPKLQISQWYSQRNSHVRPYSSRS